MYDFNKVILSGRIGNDPELKTSATGKAYLKLSLATHSFRKNADQVKESTTHWHRVVVFGHQAEICSKYLKKGAQILLEGMLEVRTYTGDDQKKVTIVSVLASRVQFMGGHFKVEVQEEDEVALAS